MSKTPLWQYQSYAIDAKIDRAAVTNYGGLFPYLDLMQLTDLPGIDLLRDDDRFDVVLHCNLLSAHLLSILLEFLSDGKVTGKCPPAARGFARVCVAGVTTR